MEQQNKGQFNSNFGFLMAALGSAVASVIFGDSLTRWVSAEDSLSSCSMLFFL